MIRTNTLILNQVLQLTLNAGKCTIDLDISVEADIARLNKLIREADVVIQGFRYGSLGERGLSLQDMAITAADQGKASFMWMKTVPGRTGRSLSDLAGNKLEMQPRACHTSWDVHWATSLGPACFPPLLMCDMTTDVVGALATMMAIQDRAQRGASYHVAS